MIFVHILNYAVVCTAEASAPICFDNDVYYFIHIALSNNQCIYVCACAEIGADECHHFRVLSIVRVDASKHRLNAKFFQNEMLFWISTNKHTNEQQKKRVFFPSSIIKSTSNQNAFECDRIDRANVTSGHRCFSLRPIVVGKAY